jgi:hypothetical protein
VSHARRLLLAGHIVRAAERARAEGKSDWRRVLVRRPVAWSREDFSTYHLEHQQRGDWTYMLDADGDVATLVVGDRLLEV